MSAPDDDQPLVEFVAVNGSVVDPPAAPDVLAVEPHGPSRRIRLLALGTLTLVAAGLVVAAAHHGRGSPSADSVNPPAAAGTAAPSAVPHALHTVTGLVPAGVPVGELPTPAQARVEQRRLAGQLAQEQISLLASLRPVQPNHVPDCPAATSRCTVIVGSMPVPALTAVRARIPDAKPVRDLEISGTDARGALYFRQLQVKSRGCVLTLQLAAGNGAAGNSGADGGDVVMVAGSGRLMAARHPAPDGFVASFRLTGKARACPSDSTLRAIAADPRLLVAG